MPTAAVLSPRLQRRRGILSENALTIMKQRYFAPGEDAEKMWRRVANGNEDYYKLMSELRFLPNSPTLMNAHTGNKCTLSACFHFVVEDTMFDSPDGIVPIRAKAAAVAKAGGGVGYYLGKLRPKGDLIKSIHRKACGPVAVLKDYQGVRQLITQGGKRDLAQMGILPCWHQDIREFIHVKDNDPEALNSFNISVSWTDAALNRVFAAFPSKDTNDRQLWDEQIESAWRTGDPGVYFYDTNQRTNPTPWLGELLGTNPCGEVPLLPNEPCNLGSINLALYAKGGHILWNELLEDVRTATLFLDEILNWNHFPHPDITAAAMLTRKLGLGVMGWADMLALLHIHYDTNEAVELGEKIMEQINSMARMTSKELAEKHGPFPGYDASKAKYAPIRNATRTCIAPTGTIALLAGCSSGIEPHYALEWDRKTFEGLQLHERISVWDELDGFVPKVANEIPLEWHIKHQAAFQKHTDLAVSKTINMPNSATKEEVSRAYRLMWEMGCKGGTIYRDGCRAEQVLTTKKTKSIYAIGNGQPVAETPKRRKLPQDRNSITHKLHIDGFEGYLTVGLYEDGTPGEIFFKASKEGTTVSGLLDAWAIAISLALQHGTPLETLVKLYTGSRFEPAGRTGNKAIPTCSSIADYVFRFLRNRFAAKDEKAETPGKNGHTNGRVRSGMFCPDCGSEAVYHGGCLQCSDASCAWTRCG